MTKRDQNWRVGWLLAALAVAGCTAGLPNRAFMPNTGYGGPVLTDQGAIQLVSYTLTDPVITRGNPALGAQSMAVIDYLAGELDADPRWVAFPAGAKLQMIQARGEIRALLGISPEAPSQEVVDRLLSAAAAFNYGDRAAALGVLTAPVFTRGPDATAAILANLPSLPLASAAAHRALVSEDQQHNGSCRIVPCF